MLTEKENNKIIDDFDKCLNKVGLKRDLVYVVNTDNALFKNSEKAIFQIGILPNALYPNINVSLYSKNMETVGKLGFTKPDYFPSYLDEKDPVFGPDRMYDIKFLKQFKDLLNCSIDKELYLNERERAKEVLKSIEDIIKENKLED